MEWLQTLLDSSTTPVLTAFLLGLLTAISPCPLATNIAAIGYIGKDIEDRRRVFLNGLLYTAGRIVAYTCVFERIALHCRAHPCSASRSSLALGASCCLARH